MERVTSFVHRFLMEHLSPDAMICDLTAGNGNDSLFCVQHFKHVIAFDIQEEAIQATQTKCKNALNLRLIHDDHANVSQYVHEPIDAVLFNSGYLPKSNSPLTTHPTSSCKAIESSFKVLKKGGYLCATFYLKQALGIEEYESCMNVIGHLSGEIISQYTYPDDPLSPRVIVFQKF